MKSHTDAASRPAVEVVTQLPVPSRLGMLRFERLNEASWTLLFLDASCEAQLGLAAGELCGLIGSPYASLMEPEERYQLHDTIQLQLKDSPHYKVHYRLHTPNGMLHLVELGEAFKQHGRQLLRGYLLAADEPVFPDRQPQQSELQIQNSRLQASLELYQRSQEEHLQHLVRSRAQQSMIVRLARHRYSSDNQVFEAAQLITKAACETFNVDRANLWHLRQEMLDPITMYSTDIG